MIDKTHRVKSAGAARRFALRLALASMTMALAMVTAWAQRTVPPTISSNFDVRTDRDLGAAYLARTASSLITGAHEFTGARASALARLQSAVGALDVVINPELGTPEVVSVKSGSGFLTAPASDRVAAMRGFLSDYSEIYGLSTAQIAGLDLVADYVNPAGNMAWVEFEQRINGLPVFQGAVRGGFTARGELARTTGVLGSGLDAAQLPSTPTLTAARAVAEAAANVGWSVASNALVQTPADGGRVKFAAVAPMTGDARAWLLYFPLAPGVARLAWATEIMGDPDAFLVILDAEDGTVLFRKNLTEHQSQAVTYGFYSDDSPAPLSPTSVLPGQGTQAPFVARTTRTLIGNEPPNTFNSLGWQDDGESGSVGNSVGVYIDLEFPGIPSGITCTPFRVCDTAYNPQTDDPRIAPYKRGEVTDMFYWGNVYHDRLYLLGFTEAARNFQDNNFGRGGVGNDRVQGFAQIAPGAQTPGFSTPVDGGVVTMRMAIFTIPTPDRTSGIDHDVLLHELTHGTSNRLHNNAAGLSSTMARGMGEGWSDFYARALLSSADEDPNGVYASGAWSSYQMSAGYTNNYYYGLRRFPYASISTVGANGKPHNPLTFADIDAAQINTTDGAYPNNPIIANTAFEVHNIGEVWASALFEVRARFISRLGWATGNQRILQFVTDAMKLDPVNPTLLQGRDSIIAAANAGGGTAADISDIWAGFAVRGMSPGAQVTDANAGTVVQSFDLALITAVSGTLVSESIPNGRIDPNEVVGVSLCLGNAGVATSSSVTGTLLAAGGVLSPSGPQSYGAIGVGGSVCRTYTLTAGASCGASVSATLQAQQSGGGTRSLTVNFQVGTVLTLFSQNFDGVTAPALPAGWSTTSLSGTNPWATYTTTPDSPPNFAFNGAAQSQPGSDAVLVSPTVTVPVTGGILTFRHSFLTSTSSGDAGSLEIGIGGGAFQDIVAAGGTFVTGAGASNQAIWSGFSGGYITTTIKMPPAAAGQNVVLRWRYRKFSTGTGNTGWSVDTISLVNFKCSRPAPADYEADGKSDLAVFRPSNGTWYVRQSGTGAGAFTQWGLAGDVPVPGDYDGDGKSDHAVFRPSTSIWYIRNSSNGSLAFLQWGVTGDIAVPGDYDGDGKTDAAVFRPSTGIWYVRDLATNTASFYQWGLNGDIPVSADYDGDWKTDVAVFRPSTGIWYIRNSSDNSTSFLQWGITGDIPVPGDYDGDSKADSAVFRPSTNIWYVRNLSTNTASFYQWGLSGDIQAPGDYDGDGKTDVAVFRPSNGTWYIWYVGSGTFAYYNWGLSGDIPVLKR